MVLPHHFKVCISLFFFLRDVERDDFSPLKTTATEKLIKGAVFETPKGVILPLQALLCLLPGNQALDWILTAD